MWLLALVDHISIRAPSCEGATLVLPTDVTIGIDFNPRPLV